MLLPLILSVGCEQKLKPGNPFEQYDSDEEAYAQSTISKYDDAQELSFSRNYPDVVAVEMLGEDGTPFTIGAIEGQVCVWYKDGVSFNYVQNSIMSLGGIIVAQIPENCYCLVEVPANEVQVFLRKITKDSDVNRAYPNMVYYPCAVNNYILDNFNPYYSRSDGDTTPHGDIVQYALQEYAEGISLMPYNIGTSDGQYMNNKKYFENGRFCPIFGCTNSEVYAIKDISKNAGSGPIIINMSFGPALPERMINGKEVGYYWNNATDDEKQEYRERYLLFMKETIKNLEPLNGKDFVVVKSAGNSGVKTFDNDIIAYLRDHLSTKEKEVMDKHILLVAAGETERLHQDYSNEMESGHYDPWVTKTDISDFKFEGKKMRGTSFAAPRTAGILSSVANDMNLTGAEVLRLAREVTKHDGELTEESLFKAVEDKKPSSNEYSINGCLLYRLIIEIGTDMEILELHNNCNDDIRVKGYLLNTIASHGGANTLNFDKIIKANQTEYVEGFIENECTIISVEKVVQNHEQQKNNTKIVGTMWRWDFSKNPDIEWYDALRFDDESNGTALSVYQGDSTVITHFHYFYNEEYDGWCVTDWGQNIMYFVINGNELNMGFCKPCVINGNNIIFDSRRYYRM